MAASGEQPAAASGEQPMAASALAPVLGWQPEEEEAPTADTTAPQQAPTADTTAGDHSRCATADTTAPRQAQLCWQGAPGAPPRPVAPRNEGRIGPHVP